MKISTRSLGLASVMAAGALTAAAGNIPQYQFKKSDAEFRFLEGATAVTSTYGEAPELIFLGDRYYINAHTGEGFPIGFNFRYGGKEFNQFAINNNGSIMLGQDKIESRGYISLWFNNASLYASNEFYLGMGPVKYGIKDGEISYKLEGEPGNRTMTIQFAHMQFREPGVRGNAAYSEQIVLHEADGRVDINFREEEASFGNLGLFCGLHGWSNEDNLLLYGYGLGETIDVAPVRVHNMLDNDSYITWLVDDELGYDHLDPYSYNFSFTPTGSETFTCEAPADLGAEQRGDDLIITCHRPTDAPATMILISTEPFGEDDLPQQGVSYPVKNDANEYVTKFGNATLIYYNDDEIPTATFSGVEPSTDYYVKAIGVNGYPAYSFSTAADMVVRSSHPAPTSMLATSARGAINLRTYCPDEVIIAATTERVTTSTEGITGIFGQPTIDSKAGSWVPGGGKVIYVGPAGDFSYTDAPENRQVFFRAWSIRDGQVSKTYTNATGVTTPSLPYDPKLDLYTLYEVPLGWTAISTCTDAGVMADFVPRMRGANEDEAALGGVSSFGSSATLTSPLITFANASDLKLHFEWSLETTKELPEIGGTGPSVVLPEGREPGTFGTGHSFTVTAGLNGTENKLYEATSYDGTMQALPDDPDHYIDGTSTMIPVTVDFPVLRGGKVQFRFTTAGFSILYLKNIFITNGEVGIKETIDLFGQDMISGQEGAISILSAAGGNYEVYALDGRHVSSVKLEAGEGALLSADKGIYIVNGVKVAVR